MVNKKNKQVALDAFATAFAKHIDVEVILEPTPETKSKKDKA
jgi:hypothetical protein